MSRAVLVLGLALLGVCTAIPKIGADSDRQPVRQEKSGACNPEFRNYDGSCTNIPHTNWGKAGTALYSYIYRRSSTTPTGKDFPSARLVSNVLATQSGDTFNRRRLSEFVVFFGQFLDHMFVATTANKKAPMPIPIPRDDPIFANFSGGVLPFSRSFRGVPLGENGVQRPINFLSSAIDLATVYSSAPGRAHSLRVFQHGLLKTTKGDMLPVNSGGLTNMPSNGASFYLCGDVRANENPVLTSIHTLFVREHNKLCHELKEVFPEWDDTRMFEMARKINIAQFQKIVFKEWFPRITGRQLSGYSGFKSSVNPSISDVFSTAAFRLGHTMVGNVISRRGTNNKKMSPLTMGSMFFRSIHVMNEGVEPFLRGAMGQRAQEIDTMVVPALRNFLFTGIPDQGGFDLIALNIQRSRDHAIPTYNEIRKLFGRPLAQKFSDITKNLAVQNKLQTAYGTPDKVEAWMGLMAEDHEPGSSMGPTNLRIWRTEFTRLRDGDRYFYDNKSLFPAEIWTKFPRLRQIMSERDTMMSVILRNCNISKAEIGASVWLA